MLESIKKFLPALGLALGNILEKNIGKLFFSACEDYVFAWERLSKGNQEKIKNYQLEGISLETYYLKSQEILSTARNLDKILSEINKPETGFFGKKDVGLTTDIDGFLEAIGEVKS